MKNKKLNMWMSILGVVLLVVCIGSVVTSSKAYIRESKKIGSIAEIVVPDVPEVTTTRANGVVSAAEWAPYYSDIYESYMKNEENGKENRASYVDDDPDIQILYDGIGFSFDYTEAIGHSYTLEDINETTRPHKLANCLTCKTPDMTAMVNAMGKDVYSMDFDEVFSQVSEPVSCYTCHGNTPGTIEITHDYMREAMSDEIDAGKVAASVVSCAQCHIEYYFDPETKATSVPYDSLDNMNPDDILAYYNEMGFVDYTNSNTGVGMLKAQHSEFETFYGEGSVHKGMYTCADCHMGVAYNDSGDPYASHYLTSPLDNQELIQSTCSTCHSDLEGMVKAIQKEITGREKEVSAKLVTLNTKLADAVKNNTLSEADLAKVRSLDRDAQFYWDFVYVENAEGAHNSALSRECLDKAEKLADEALEMLK